MRGPAHAPSAEGGSGSGLLILSSFARPYCPGSESRARQRSVLSSFPGPAPAPGDGSQLCSLMLPVWNRAHFFGILRESR